MEPKTNWGRIFGGILLLAVIYLLWWALNVGKDANYGEVTTVIKPEAYRSSRNVLMQEAVSGDDSLGDDDINE